MNMHEFLKDFIHYKSHLPDLTQCGEFLTAFTKLLYHVVHNLSS